MQRLLEAARGQQPGPQLAGQARQLLRAILGVGLPRVDDLAQTLGVLCVRAPGPVGLAIPPSYSIVD